MRETLEKTMNLPRNNEILNNGSEVIEKLFKHTKIIKLCQIEHFKQTFNLNKNIS